MPPKARPQRGVEEVLATTLAKNVSTAREARAMTQAALAKAARTSRATINQIESGHSDPRLSTIANVAAALEVSPLLLLVARHEFVSVQELIQDTPRAQAVTNAVSPEQLSQIATLFDSGLRRDRKAAARLAATNVRDAGLAAGGAAAGAAIGSLMMPGVGTAVGAVLGSLLYRTAKRQGR
jgi:transcriptional regulator with XRE-family HTH domain